MYYIWKANFLFLADFNEAIYCCLNHNSSNTELSSLWLKDTFRLNTWKSNTPTETIAHSQTNQAIFLIFATFQEHFRKCICMWTIIILIILIILCLSKYCLMTSKGKLVCEEVLDLFHYVKLALNMTTHSLFNSFYIQRSSAMKCNDRFLRHIYFF